MAEARVRIARKSRTGREQRRRSHTARSRRPNLTTYYSKRMPSVHAGEFDFTLDLLRGVKIVMTLDKAVKSFEWTDAEAMLTGNVQMQRPDPESRQSLPVTRGDRIRCRVKWGASWYEVWTMRCGVPDVTVETGEVSVDLQDDMSLVRGGKKRYVFRRTKRRKHGYFGHEMLRIAARRDGIRLGAIVKCKSRMPKIDLRGSFLDLAEKVYERESDKTGVKFVLRMRDGKFEVVPYKRNSQLYVLAEQLREASVTLTPKVDDPVTVLIGKGRTGKGHAAKKLRHTEFRREMVERFGRVEKEKDYGRVDSLSDLKKQMKRDLADQYKVDTVVTVQHAGLPFVRRGDGVQCVLRSEGLTGDRSFMYVTNANHQVQEGTYTSGFEFTRDDPFEADRERREKAAREKARKRRKQRKRGAQN